MISNLAEAIAFPVGGALIVLADRLWLTASGSPARAAFASVVLGGVQFTASTGA